MCECVHVCVCAYLNVCESRMRRFTGLCVEFDFQRLPQLLSTLCTEQALAEPGARRVQLVYLESLSYGTSCLGLLSAGFTGGHHTFLNFCMWVLWI